MRRVLRWTGWLIGGAVAALIVAAIATARSGDSSLYPPQAGARHVEVLVVSHGYHAGVIVPRAAIVEVAGRRDLAALGAAVARFSAYPQLEVGWGDEGFYTLAPTAASVTVAMAVRALFKPGNPSVLHLVGLAADPRTAFPGAEIVTLSLSEAGFERLAAMLDVTFARSGPDRGIEELGRGLYGPSLFFRAVGTFHLLRVCNHWVADLLDAAGVPTAPVVATWPQGLLWDLSWRAGGERLPPATRQ